MGPSGVDDASSGGGVVSGFDLDFVVFARLRVRGCSEVEVEEVVEVAVKGGMKG